MRNWIKERSGRLRRLLRKRGLCWFGSRASDAEPLAYLGELTGVYCLIAPAAIQITQECLEDYKGVRVDLDSYDTDEDHSTQAMLFKRAFMSGPKRRCVLISYRPAAFVDAVRYTKGQDVFYASNHYLCQRAFEHKPWVEKEVRRLGVKTIEWHYARTMELLYSLNRHMEKESWGKAVVRTTFSSGGRGLFLINEKPDHQLLMQLEERGLVGQQDDLYSFSKFHEGCLPLNVNAIVEEGGETAVYPPSVQLIGLECCTSRSFGFCGSDFYAAKRLDEDLLVEIWNVTRKIGRWMHSYGYRGIFGVDFILTEADGLLFAEVNPRFQSSTPLLENLNIYDILSNIYVEHLGAFLGMPAWQQRMEEFLEASTQHEGTSQIAVYNRFGIPLKLTTEQKRRQTPSLQAEYLPRPGITVEPEGMLFKIYLEESVTKDGHTLKGRLAKKINDLIYYWFAIKDRY